MLVLASEQTFINFLILGKSRFTPKKFYNIKYKWTIYQIVEIIIIMNIALLYSKSYENAMIEIINNIVINIGGSFWVDVQLRSSTLRLYRLAIAHLCALTKIMHSIDWKRLKFLLVIVGKELGEFVEIFGYKDLLTCLITCPFIERHVL